MNLATQVPPIMLRNRNVGGFGSSSGLTLFGAAQNMFQQSMFDPHHNLFGMTPTLNPIDTAGRIKEDEIDSKSGSENLEVLSGEEENANQRKRKKRYHRHTQHQIQEMEAFFKECPHPDDKQRKELGKELGLEPLQVKFWFQNKRTQVKTQTERHENQHLRAENDKLRAENMRFKEALANASCPTCGGPATLGEMSFDDSPLRLENVRLREEIDRISGIAARYVGKPLVQFPAMPPQLPARPLDLVTGNFGMHEGIGGDMYGLSVAENLRAPVPGTTEGERPMVVDLAVSGMEELVRMAQLGEPLWVQGVDSACEILHEEEYLRMFPRGIGARPLGLKCEASRETAVVIMNPINIVELLMDKREWTSVFSCIVSRAETYKVLSTGVAGNFNGALQVMSAEFQVPSPLVPTRESFFVRYCKLHSEGTWAVVDVSLDHLRNSPVMRCHRRPSGCLIQELPNGYSKVVWVENVEVDDRAVHKIYKPLVNSTLAFGAKRWVATLDRQSERHASHMLSNMPSGEASVITSPEGRKGMLKLAQRMVLSFCSGVSASTAHTWTTLSGSGAEDVRVMTRKSIDDPGRPPGIVLSAATSFWLPIPPKRIFDFLRNETNRPQWDVLSSGGDIQEVAHIVNGRDPGNSVSLLRVNASNPSQSNMLIIQESTTDASGSFVVYAPVDIVAMNMVLNGGDPDYVALLPSGFAVLPDGTTTSQSECGGSLLTVAFQILVDSAPTAKLSLGSVATVNNLIACTVEKVKASFERSNT